MLNTLLNISPLFLLIFLGFLLYKIKLGNADWIKILNTYSLNLGFPALIFCSLTQSDVSILDYQELILINSIFLILCFVVCFGASYFFTGPLKRTFPICITFSNIAFLGIPTLKQIYGNSVLAEAGIIASCYLFWVFTVGIGHLEYHKLGKIDLKSIFINLFKNPLLISVLLGTIVNIFTISLPKIIFQPIQMIASSVTPLVLIALGIFMGTISFQDKKSWSSIIGFSLVTLLVIPSIIWAVFGVFGIDSKLYKTTILEAAMPVAVTPFALAEKYNLDQDFIAKIIIVSTLLSIISISFWTTLL